MAKVLVAEASTVRISAIETVELALSGPPTFKTALNVELAFAIRPPEESIEKSRSVVESWKRSMSPV